MELHRLTSRILAFLFFILLNGLPVFSQNYFQQQVDYTINVSLNDKKHTLSAFEQMEYTNNSPDALNEIWIHLWPNAYKNNTSALVKQQVENGNLSLFFADDKERGFIDSLDFKINGKSVPFEFKEIDYGKIKLPEPLLPGKKIIITTPFFVKIPNARFSRLGHDKQAYYISQWYPKPAVYDAKGWHAYSCLDQGEFYSEFGTYQVTIELPKNYVLGATGELLDDRTEYKWLSEKAQATAEINSFSNDMSFPASDTVTKALTYRQSNVHDFAWFADKRWHVLKGEVTLPNSKRKVTTWSMFTNNKAKAWKNSIDYINQTLYYYSLWNGDYLYNHCTAVDGVISAGIGMEYPMITICGGEGDSIMLEAVITHEVGHNWFYGMLGSNEREHPWMDEGINSFNEMRLFFLKHPKEEFGNLNELMLSGKMITRLFGLKNLDYREAWQLEYTTIASMHADQPIEYPAVQYTSGNYGVCVYRKTGIALQYLRSYLGDADFDRCMQEYFNTWKLKHPYPEDLKKIFVSVTGNNLDWFFNDLMPTTKTIDYKIKKVKKTGDQFTLSIANKGEINSPFELYGLRGTTPVVTVKQEGFSRNQKITLLCPDCDAFEIDYFHQMPDIYRNNNRIRTEGMFKKLEPLTFNFIPKLNPNGRSSVNVLPAMGWNNYNKLMAGLVLYDKFLPVKRFEYSLATLYGFGDKQFAGCGELNYNVYQRTGYFDFIGLSLNGKRFAYLNSVIRESFTGFTDVNFQFTRIEPKIKFSIRKKAPTSIVKNNFSISLVSLFTDNTVLKERIKINDSTSYNITGLENQNYQTLRLLFMHEAKRALDPYSYNFQFEGNAEYGKLSFTGNYKFNYKGSKKGVAFRLFAGSFLYNDVNAAVQYPYNLSGWDGQTDYWFDEYYFGRSESTGILSQQMSMNDGNFKLAVPYARVTTWMTALNLKADLPGNLPLKVFLDVGTFKNAKSVIEDYNDNILINGGICVSLVKDVVECYLPLLKSKGIKNYVNDQNLKFSEQIRFVFNLRLMNPLYLRNQLFK